MFKRLLMSSLLSTSLVVMIGAEARAGGIGGWAWTGFSNLNGSIIVTGPPKAVIRLGLDLTLELACSTDGGGNFSIGKPFSLTLQVDAFTDEGVIIGPGTTAVPVVVPLDNLVSPENCQNPNGWKPLEDGVGVLDGLITMEYFRCTGKDDDPCFDDNGALTIAKKPFDNVTIFCSLTEIRRNSDGTTVGGQVMICPEV
jgi:hypothetical protein